MTPTHTQGEIIHNFTPPPHPKGLSLLGNRVNLQPLDADKHAETLFTANALDKQGENWTYLPYGPFHDLKKYKNWLKIQEIKKDPVFFTITRLSDHKAVGVASYLRINPTDGSIEVGHINYSPLLQRTIEGTEAMYLLMKWAFENGYRRYEWKCNALNTRSRNTAQRLGLSYEGVFRQMTIANGRNRNTAWFAAIDKEWPNLKKCFDTYLAPDNLDANGHPKISLAKLTKPMLYKQDNMEFST